MSDIIDINVAQTVEEVTINVTEEVIQVNINQVNGGGGVPYTGATSDVNLGEFGLLTGNVEFDNTPTNIPTAAGGAYWNDADGTLDLILKGGNVKLQVGQEQVIRVVNKTATNIDLLESNYQAVRVTGAQGQRLKVDLAQATTDNLSAETIGLVTETINNNQEGFITTSGLVRNINTTGSLQGETWADGDIVYLSPTTAGRITKVKPEAPNHLVIIGYVVSAHATQGSIFVKVDNGYELDELHNVKIDTPLDNQGLVYNSTLEVWENKAINLQRVLEAGGTSNNGEILLSYTGSDYRMFINGDQLLSYDITTNESISIIPPFITVNGTSNNLLIKPSKFEFLQGAFKTEITRATPTANRVITFKDETGTVALTSDIPSPITIDATPTDGSSNAVSSNGVFDALALKANLASPTFTGVVTTPLLALTSTTNGLLPNALTSVERDAIVSPIAGTMIFNTTEGYPEYYDTFWGWMPLYTSNEWKAKNGFEYSNDFMTFQSGDGFIIIANSGSGSTSINASTINNRPGIQTLSTASSATAISRIQQVVGSTANSTFRLGGGRMIIDNWIRIPTLSDVTNRFQTLIGVGSSANGINQNSGLLFYYDEGGVSTGSTASANWQVVSANANVRTWTTTSVPVVANQWYRLTIEINDACTSVVYKIDGVTVRTETTNMPTSLDVGILTGIFKSAGTTARTLDVDYLGFKQKFTTAR